MSCTRFLFAFALPALAVLVQSPAARAGDFLNMRLSFNITDENVLVKPGETVPSIPGPRIGTPIPRWGSLFFDNYDTRANAFENTSNMVLYKLVADGADDYEGAFVLRFNNLSDDLSAVRDGGSYLKYTHWFDPTRADKANLTFTAFPMAADMFRLGYSYKISWGGSPIFFKTNPDNPFASTGSSNSAPVPGFKMQLADDEGYVFLGAKTSMRLNESINEQQTIYGVLGGAGYDVTEMLRLETNGGFFHRGVNPIQSVLGRPMQTVGASAQAMVHDGAPVGRSVDFNLYKNDPSGALRVFQDEQYPGGVSWLLSAEGTYTSTVLQDARPDYTANIVRQPALAGDVNARLKIDHLRVHADLTYMDLAFMLINVPSFVPYQAISSSIETVTPQIFAAGGVDYFFTGPKLTVGVTGGIQTPATFKGHLPPSFTNALPAEAIPDSSVVVIRSEGVFDILPAGYKVVPIYATKLSAVLEVGGFRVLAETLCAYDNNVTRLTRVNNDPQQVSTRIFNKPWQLGFNVAFQARL